MFSCWGFFYWVERKTCWLSVLGGEPEETTQTEQRGSGIDLRAQKTQFWKLIFSCIWNIRCVLKSDFYLIFIWFLSDFFLIFIWFLSDFYLIFLSGTETGFGGLLKLIFLLPLKHNKNNCSRRATDWRQNYRYGYLMVSRSFRKSLDILIYRLHMFISQDTGIFNWDHGLQLIRIA